MNWLLIHTVIAAVACGIPLLVVAVVRAVARSDADEVAWTASRRRIGWLVGATAVSWIAFGLWLVVDREAVAAGQRGPALAAAELAAFALLFGGLAMPAMSATIRALPPAAERGQDRAATLVPRTLRCYLSWPAMSLPYLLAASAVVTVAVRVPARDPERPQLMGAVMAAAVLALVALYGRWLSEIVLRPQTLPATEVVGVAPALELLRRAEIITVYRWQVGLAVVLSPASVGLTHLDFSSPAAIAILATSSIVAATGCARALTSGFFRYPLRTSPQRS
jgi:hypothetical protein